MLDTFTLRTSVFMSKEKCQNYVIPPFTQAIILTLAIELTNNKSQNKLGLSWAKLRHIWGLDVDWLDLLQLKDKMGQCSSWKYEVEEELKMLGD